MPRTTGVQPELVGSAEPKPALIEGWVTARNKKPRTPPMASQITKNSPTKIMLRRLLRAISLYMGGVLAGLVDQLATGGFSGSAVGIGAIPSELEKSSWGTARSSSSAAKNATALKPNGPAITLRGNVCNLML